MSTDIMDIEYYRNEIDAIDQKVLELVNKRAGLALNIAKLKQELSRPIFDPEREKRILEHLKSQNKGPLSGSAIENIFSIIISENRELENKRSNGG